MEWREEGFTRGGCAGAKPLVQIAVTMIPADEPGTSATWLVSLSDSCKHFFGKVLNNILCQNYFQSKEAAGFVQQET